MQTKTDTCANSVDPDKMAHNDSLLESLGSIQFTVCHSLFYYRPKASMNMSKLKDGGVHFRNSGMKGLNKVKNKKTSFFFFLFFFGGGGGGGRGRWVTAFSRIFQESRSFTKSGRKPENLG